MPTRLSRSVRARYAGVVLAGISLAATLPLKTAQAQAARRAALAKAIDSIATAFLKDGKGAGLSVAVVKGRDTLALKGYGSADLELDVDDTNKLEALSIISEVSANLADEDDVEELLGRFLGTMLRLAHASAGAVRSR